MYLRILKYNYPGELLPHNQQQEDYMKKVAKAWQTIELTERVIFRLADLYFEEKDWFCLLQQDESIDLIVDMLFMNDIITTFQNESWYLRQEWVSAKKLAEFKTDQPSRMSAVDRKAVRKLTVSIAILENKIEKIINQYK